MDLVRISEAVGLGDFHVLVGIAVEVLADLRKIIAGLHGIGLSAGDDLNIVFEVGEAGVDGLDAVPDAVLAGFGDDRGVQRQLFPVEAEGLCATRAGTSE